MTPPVTLSVAAALQQARLAGIDRLDAQLLLAHTLQQPRTWLIAHDDAHLTSAQTQHFQAWLARRATGEPLAYLVGEKEFHGLSLRVSPDVLVPRPETETLVDWGLALLATDLAHHPSPRVIDLGTGSGAIALAIKHQQPHATVCALDASQAALAMAQSNAAQLQLAVTWLHSHWWAGVAGQRFHLALSNPPYIAGDDAHLAALHHEPRAALTPEGDGLSALRDIIALAPAHLAPGAWLLLEHGYDQAQAVQNLLRQSGFQQVQTRIDLAGIDRCTGGHWP